MISVGELVMVETNFSVQVYIEYKLNKTHTCPVQAL